MEPIFTYPLMISIFYYKIFKLILSNTRNINIINSCGHTPLIVAINNNLIKIVKLLLNRGPVIT